MSPRGVIVALDDLHLGAGTDPETGLPMLHLCHLSTLGIDVPDQRLLVDPKVAQRAGAQLLLAGDPDLARRALLAALPPLHAGGRLDGEGVVRQRAAAALGDEGVAKLNAGAPSPTLDPLALDWARTLPLVQSPSVFDVDSPTARVLRARMMLGDDDGTLLSVQTAEAIARGERCVVEDGDCVTLIGSGVNEPSLTHIPKSVADYLAKIYFGPAPDQRVAIEAARPPETWTVEQLATAGDGPDGWQIGHVTPRTPTRTLIHVTPDGDLPGDHQEGRCACQPHVDEATRTVFHRPLSRAAQAPGERRESINVGLNVSLSEVLKWQSDGMRRLGKRAPRRGELAPPADGDDWSSFGAAWEEDADGFVYAVGGPVPEGTPPTPLVDPDVLAAAPSVRIERIPQLPAELQPQAESTLRPEITGWVDDLYGRRP